jgi:GAF domain-containing protein
VEVLARYSAPVHDKMMPAPIPADEEERLASLGAWNETLDLDRAPAFHRVTVKLARIFDVPMALVSIMEREQQRIRSQVGFKPELLPEQGIPRAESVCGHAIAANEVLVIEDLARDKRFARNPWLLERELRFYAGVPLRTEDGQPVGTICIFDTRPRQLSDRDHRMLRMIAEDLMEELSIQGGIPLAKIA